MTGPRRLYRTVKNRVLHAVSPLLASTRRANVAMFHVGRVGSTVVAELLDQHSRMDWAGEFHHPRSVDIWSSHLLEEDPIRRLRMRMALAGLQVFGFETKYVDGGDFQRLNMSLEAYVDELKKLGFTHFILLERKNMLRRFVSTAVGRERGGQWHNRGDQTLTTITFDTEHVRSGPIRRPLLEWFERIEHDKHRLHEHLSNSNLLRVSYEDHVRDNPKRAYRKICSFVGLDPEPAEITIKKSNPYPLQDILVNYEEVAQVLKGSEYEWMLYE